MSSQAQVFPITESVKRRLVKTLQSQPDVIRFAEEPVLASLCTVLALQFEMGSREFDRLSLFFNVDLNEFSENPWRSEIISSATEFGIRLWMMDGRSLLPRHPDLANILSSESLDADGKLDQIVIYPARVAARYKEVGFDLVVVRDWLLTSALSLDPTQQVSYLKTNPWELENNIALMQVKLMTQNQLAFFGTHDIADHLLGADFHKFNELEGLYRSAQRILQEVFATECSSHPLLLQMSYFIGILLDDLAQAKWYGSKAHVKLVRMALHSLKEYKGKNFYPKVLSDLPPSFHVLVSHLREGASKQCQLTGSYMNFVHDLTACHVPVTTAVC